MDQPQPTAASKTPRFPLTGALLTAPVLSALVFGGYALFAWQRYEQKEKPQAQVREYLQYLDTCIQNIDNVKAHGLGPKNDFWDEVGVLTYYRRHPKTEEEGLRDEERVKRISRMMVSTGVWVELIERCVDDLDGMRAEVAKVRSIVVATVGENASRFTTDTWQALEDARLPNLKIEYRDYRYYLNENDSAMVHVPIVVGIGVFAFALVGWIGIATLNALSPGGNAAYFGTVMFPWTYPHLGWRRLSFVCAPLLGGVTLLMVHRNEYAGVITIVAFLAGAPLLLIGKEVGSWVQRGFKSESHKSPSSTPPPGSQKP